jgi:ABC-type uncharacterized transport system permease subunit
VRIVRALAQPLGAAAVALAASAVLLAAIGANPLAAFAALAAGALGDGIALENTTRMGPLLLVGLASRSRSAAGSGTSAAKASSTSARSPRPRS